MLREGGRGETCTGFWWRNIGARNHWEDPDVKGRIIIRWICRKWDVGLLTGSSWLKIDRWRVLVNAVMDIRVP
jgi:hypothetical protein